MTWNRLVLTVALVLLLVSVGLFIASFFTESVAEHTRKIMMVPDR